MPLEETDHELASAEIFAGRLFGVLESIVLLQFIALEACMLMGLEGDSGEVSRLELLVSIWLVGILVYFTLPHARQRSASWKRGASNII